MSEITSKPWKNEPEKADWESHGLVCAMRRGPDFSGHWCGYVGVPETHFMFGKAYDDVGADVHGGLTYASQAHWEDGDKSLYFFGFDCAHAGDLSPAYVDKGDRRFIRLGDVYRDFDYVKRQTESLAKQLAALAVDPDASRKRLEAAAPELLELVKMVHHSFGGGNIITFSDNDIERFAEVFAKATGEQS